MLKNDKLYTVQIHLSNGDKVGFTNRTGDQVENLRSRIFTHGFLIKRTEISHEVISPFRINTIFVLEQGSEI